MQTRQYVVSGPLSEPEQFRSYMYKQLAAQKPLEVSVQDITQDELAKKRGDVSLTELKLKMREHSVYESEFLVCDVVDAPNASATITIREDRIDITVHTA